MANRAGACQVTKEQAMNSRYGQEIHYGPCEVTVGPRGGKTYHQVRVRVSGQCQTWKTRPHEFRLPVKYGLYESGAITHVNAGDFHMPEECPIK